MIEILSLSLSKRYFNLEKKKKKKREFYETLNLFKFQNLVVVVAAVAEEEVDVEAAAVVVAADSEVEAELVVVVDAEVVVVEEVRWIHFNQTKYQKSFYVKACETHKQSNWIKSNQMWEKGDWLTVTVNHLNWLNFDDFPLE